jgi:2-dehydro-3-deoxygluconokinase
VIENAGAVHISGLTPSLSDSCRELAFEVVERAPTCAIDINYRARLGLADTARATLSELAQGSDVVIVTGEDTLGVFGVVDGDIPSGVIRGLAMAALKLEMYGDQLRVEPSEVEAGMTDFGREVIR